MKKVISVMITLLFLITHYLQAQQVALDSYIKEALESNIALQQQSLSYESSLATLEEAKALFFPKLSIQARYSVARGGRNFVIPVGDLMNPVYQNLNLINGMAQAANPDYPTIPEYPEIENVEEGFLRATDQETVLRLQMPIYNNAIIQNHKIRQQFSEADRIGVEIYKRELIKEIKQAYFGYAQAKQGVAILEEALELVQENLRTSESLQRNHKATFDVVYSAQAEVQEVKQQLAEAKKNEQVAKAYFNFLLNREYNQEIVLTKESEDSLPAINLKDARHQALQQREEIQQLNFYLSANDKQVQLQKGNRLPQINLQADYGIQGTDYTIDQDADFFLGSAVLSWNLYDRTTSAKVQKAKVEKLKMQSQKQEIQQQIGLQTVQAYYELDAAQQKIVAAKAEVEAARQAFRLVNKRFEQGQANLVSFTNARTQLTNAQQQQSIAIYNYQSKLAEFERVTASYVFE